MDSLNVIPLSNLDSLPSCTFSVSHINAEIIFTYPPRLKDCICVHRMYPVGAFAEEKMIIINSVAKMATKNESKKIVYFHNYERELMKRLGFNKISELHYERDLG